MCFLLLDRRYRTLDARYRNGRVVYTLYGEEEREDQLYMDGRASRPAADLTQSSTRKSTRVNTAGSKVASSSPRKPKNQVEEPLKNNTEEITEDIAAKYKGRDKNPAARYIRR